MSTLKAKAPDDAHAYRDFVLNVAKSVGEAAKGTTASENDAIQKIEPALATAWSTSPLEPTWRCSTPRRSITAEHANGQRTPALTLHTGQAPQP
jgi:hypothetical protein